VQQCLRLGNARAAERVRQIFKLPDKRFGWIKVGIPCPNYSKQMWLLQQSGTCQALTFACVGLSCMLQHTASAWAEGQLSPHSYTSAVVAASVNATVLGAKGKNYCFHDAAHDVLASFIFSTSSH